MNKSTAEIRQAFVDFFHQKGHQIVSSSSLVPTNDSTLLFTNAGMNQFKDVFLGTDKRAYTKAVTAQRCVRAGGKHNDLENVGYTARHHTFFEMLGNFSFGDYFKRDAIRFAWELLTSTEWFNIPKEKLWVTVYISDDEAYNLWLEDIGLPSERIIRIGDNKGAPYASDNFWQMGDTGPCGPCSEIFYDHGEQYWGGLPGSSEEDGDRYIEIWNIVFMQFNRQANGEMLPLPKPSVDTGMGLERLVAVLQGVHSNYEIDVFQTLIKAAAQIIGVTDLHNKSLRVIADHARACAFLIADGVLPANENRGYVLRRIIRRAVRHGHLLGAKENFFYRLVAPLIGVMGAAANELQGQQNRIEQILKIEEEQFVRTLERGLALLDQELALLDGKKLSGEIAFRLYDTYGFPLDLTADVCRERGIDIDNEGFEQSMEQQRHRARQSSSFATDYSSIIRVETESAFCGYTELRQSAIVQGLFRNAQSVSTIHAGEEALLILNHTPFYAESGGQIGDQGILQLATGEQFLVEDTQKFGRAIGHLGRLSQGNLKIGDSVEAHVDELRRSRIRLNHSATHLLHAALRQVLGEQVMQKGSLVTDKYLRFDFSHFAAMTAEQVRRVENIVNQQIRLNLSVNTELMALELAKNRGAMALFGEKYDDQVRVLSMGDFSVELCGGTHVSRTGDIGLFRILNESGIAAGIRRVEALTGENALQIVYQQEDLLRNIANQLKADNNTLADKVESMLERNRNLERDVEHVKSQQAKQAGVALRNEVVELNGINLLVKQLVDVEPKVLRTMIDELKNQLASAVIVLATVYAGKISLIAGVTQDLTNRIHAGELVTFIALHVDGKGGGRPDMAQAGGNDLTALPKALSGVKAWVMDRL